MAVKKKKKLNATPLEVDKVYILPDEATREIVENLAEPTVKVRPTQTFKDGGLAEHFAKLGFGVEWNKKEVREIPEWLYRLCISSGGKFEEIP